MSKISSKDILKRLNGGCGSCDNKKIIQRDIKKLKLKLTNKKYNVDETPNYYELLSRMENPKNHKKIMSMKGGIFSEAATPKNIKSISNDVVDAIKKVVNNTNNAEIYGSYVYRGQYFPGDIDIQEVITATPKNKHKIFTETQKMLVKMVKDTDDYPNIFFSEVKAGYDLRYSIVIVSKDFMKKITNLYKNKLLTSEEFNKWKKLYYKYINSNRKDIEAFAELEEDIRLKRVIRWNKKEVLQGYKILPGNYKLTLLDALKIPSQIKIDIFVWIYGRFIEMTNFFYLVSYDKNKKIIEMINYDRDNYALALVSQILKYQSKLFYNPFKMAKRMWGLSRELKLSKIFNKLMPIFQGRTARMNQMVGEMKTIVDMYQKYDNIPYDKITKQLMGFKFRMSFLYNIKGYNEDLLLKMLNSMIEKVNDKKYIIDKLTCIIDEFTKIINSKTMNWLKKYNLWPVPKILFTEAYKHQMTFIIDTKFFKEAIGYTGKKEPSKVLTKIRHEQSYTDPFGEVIPLVDPNYNEVVRKMVNYDK